MHHCNLPLIMIAVLLAGILPAERLPVRNYTSLDGLPGISVHRIVPDSKGFLWFCTNEGVSRFDGYGFVNYGRANGLSDPNVYDILETREGSYWVGTAAGLFRLTKSSASSGAQSQSTFEEVLQPPGGENARWVRALMEDPSGFLWIGTNAGLFQLHPAPGKQWRFHRVELPAEVARAPYDRWIAAMLRDRRGRVWVGTGNGLYLLRSDQAEHYSTKDGLPHNFVHALFEDSRGRVWAGTADGLCALAPDKIRGSRIVEHVYTTKEGLPSNVIKAILQPARGPLWVATRAGLAELDRSADRFRTYSTLQGVSDTDILSLAEDRNGNLWIGANSGGAVKLARDGFRSYGAQDGLASSYVVGMLTDQDGKLCVVTKSPGHLFLNRFDGMRFNAAAVPAPAAYYDAAWLGWYQVVIQSRRREWWVASRAGLLRFPTSWMTPHLYNTQDGLPSNQVHQIFEDSQGRIWISTREDHWIRNGITLLDPMSNSFHQFSEADGLPSLKEMWANGFFEDRAGQIWIGLHRAGVLRYRAGRFQVLLTSDGVPPGGIRRFHQDRQGRLWLGSGYGGLARIDDPLAEHPKFAIYDTSNGLSGNEIQAITEDQWGRIYIGTGDVVDRLDPATGRVRRYTAADGLSPGEVQTALRGRDGVLWFGTAQGVSSLIPTEDSLQAPPPVRVLGVHTGGRPHPVDLTGQVEIHLPNVEANQNQLQVDYVGLSFIPGDVLRYQRRLVEAEPEWSQPTTERSVTYARLAPGSYQFLVRAVGSDGIASSSAAAVRFRILPPLWMRWWFVALSAAAAGSLLYAMHRYRVGQLLAVERLRSRLASDLHDEIGSGLSQIAILSEVAKKRLPGDRSEAAGPLDRVAEISRELLDSTNDIVWAINRDRVADLTGRMRKYATEMFSAGEIELEFETADVREDRKIDFETRRNIYLIFREGIRNIVRHSFCRHVAIHVTCNNGLFSMRVSDDGGGFDPARTHAGQGLVSMRERARSLGGQIEWKSDNGTVVTLRVPLPK